MDSSYFLISLLNGLSVGLLLFMLASGLTLIFSMMGVLNLYSDFISRKNHK